MPSVDLPCECSINICTTIKPEHCRFNPASAPFSLWASVWHLNVLRMREWIDEFVLSCNALIPSKAKKVFRAVCPSLHNPEWHSSLSSCLLSVSLRSLHPLRASPVVFYYSQCQPLAATSLFTSPILIYWLSKNQIIDLPSPVPG